MGFLLHKKQSERHVTLCDLNISTGSCQACLRRSKVEPKNNIVCSKSVSGNVLNKLVQLNHITQRGLGADPFPFGNFQIFSGKTVNLAPIGAHFTRF